MSSKLVAAFVALSLFIAGCGRSTDQAAKNQAAKSESATSQSSSDDIQLPGMKPGTMPAGCYLRATIDGKKWEATEMTPDESKLESRYRKWQKRQQLDHVRDRPQSRKHR